MFAHDVEAGASGVCRVHRAAGRQLRLHVIDEVTEMSLTGRRRAGMPSLVEGAAKQHRQLRPEMGGIVDADAIPQSVQRSSERAECRGPCIGPELVHHERQPLIGFLEGFVEDGKPCRAHVRPRWLKSKSAAAGDLGS